MTTNQPKYRSRHGARRTGIAAPSNVIHAGERFIAPRPITTTAAPARVLRPNFKANDWTMERPLHTYLPFFDSLPFIKMKAGSRRTRATSFWTDAPTGNGRADFKRGRAYAALTIAAMTADGRTSCYLERIIEAIVIDAAFRKTKGGKYSRALPPAVEGFIHELTRQIYAKTTDNQL
jgi:hypothetical protein